MIAPEAAMKKRAGPQKSCGDCHACCVELIIDTPELQKKGQTPCVHLSGGRCGIYDKRFKICREFLCGYLLFPELDEDWRPDKSGILVLQVIQASLPKDYQGAGHGIQLLVTGGEAAILRPGFAEYVFGLILGRVGVYLTAMIPRAMLNQYLEPFVAAGDLEGTRRTLLLVYRLLTASGKKQGFLRLLPHLYGLEIEKLKLRLKHKLKQ
jgi:hypothetical protein